MENFNLQEHDFNNAKNAIKKFAETGDTRIGFSQVKQKNFIFKHNVSGEELNNFITEVQAQFALNGETQVEIIKEFGQIYNALDSLDKGYVQGIMMSIKGVEEDNKRIKKLYDVQEKTISKLKDNIEKTNNNIEKTKSIENKVNNPTFLTIMLTILLIFSIFNLVINILQLCHII